MLQRSIQFSATLNDAPYAPTCLCAYAPYAPIRALRALRAHTRLKPKSSHLEPKCTRLDPKCTRLEPKFTRPYAPNFLYAPRTAHLNVRIKKE